MYTEFKESKVDPREISTNSLAFLGDSVYTMFVREHLICTSRAQAGILHRKAIKYESAKSQAKIMKYFLENNFLAEEEVEVFKRGRNNNANTVPKNVDVTTYKIATGYECLLGYIYAKKNVKRAEEIMQASIDYIDKEIAEGEI